MAGTDLSITSGSRASLFTRVLVADRAEIAVRVIRTCRDLGIASVAVYSDADRDALHVRLADEAYPIGPAEPRESYLNIERIVGVAKRARCDAVHPGYGFQAENPAFAEAVQAAGLVFVGPPASVQRSLGEKTRARRTAQAAGVPVAQGTPEPVADLAAATTAAARIGYPVVLKPAGGGGGKGIRVVSSEPELAGAWRGATGEAETAFGAPALFIEKRVTPARHVEVQILADEHGNFIWLGERDCSIQRRNQKLIEETPGPAVADTLRTRLAAAAIRVARAAGYRNAGTVEFLVDAREEIYFLEVNTRLQVEHPVTELVTGLDLVALQLRIAAGERLPFAQDEIVRRGAAIELRVTAEDPFAGFLPDRGTVGVLRLPAGPHVRVDTALVEGTVVPTEYDPLLAKIVCWGPTRDDALARARRAVAETLIGGVRTSLPCHAYVLREADFLAGRYDTGYLATHWTDRERAELDERAAIAAALVAVVARRARNARARSPETDGGWRRAAREEALRP